MKFYAVKLIKTAIDIEVYGQTVTMPINWADGMFGSIPVFNSKEDAIKYAGDEYYVIELTEEKSSEV